MEGPDPKKLKKATAQVLALLLDYERVRDEYLQAKKQSDVAMTMTANKLTQMHSLWDKLREAQGTLREIEDETTGQTSDLDLDSQRLLEQAKEK